MESGGGGGGRGVAAAGPGGGGGGGGGAQSAALNALDERISVVMQHASGRNVDGGGPKGPNPGKGKAEAKDAKADTVGDGENQGDMDASLDQNQLFASSRSHKMPLQLTEMGSGGGKHKSKGGGACGGGKTKGKGEKTAPPGGVMPPPGGVMPPPANPPAQSVQTDPKSDQACLLARTFMKTTFNCVPQTYIDQFNIFFTRAPKHITKADCVWYVYHKIHAAIEADVSDQLLDITSFEIGAPMRDIVDQRWDQELSATRNGILMEIQEQGIVQGILSWVTCRIDTKMGHLHMDDPPPTLKSFLDLVSGDVAATRGLPQSIITPLVHIQTAILNKASAQSVVQQDKKLHASIKYMVAPMDSAPTRARSEVIRGWVFKVIHSEGNRDFGFVRLVQSFKLSMLQTEKMRTRWRSW